MLYKLGGEGNNILYDDTWYFNMTKMKWLLKERLELYSFPIRIYNSICLYPLYLTYNVVFLCLFWIKEQYIRFIRTHVQMI